MARTAKIAMRMRRARRRCESGERGVREGGQSIGGITLPQFSPAFPFGLLAVLFIGLGDALWSAKNLADDMERDEKSTIARLPYYSLEQPRQIYRQLRPKVHGMPIAVRIILETENPSGSARGASSVRYAQSSAFRAAAANSNCSFNGYRIITACSWDRKNVMGSKLYSILPASLMSWAVTSRSKCCHVPRN